MINEPKLGVEEECWSSKQTTFWSEPYDTIKYNNYEIPHEVEEKGRPAVTDSNETIQNT